MSVTGHAKAALTITLASDKTAINAGCHKLRACRFCNILKYFKFNNYENNTSFFKNISK